MQTGQSNTRHARSRIGGRTFIIIWNICSVVSAMQDVWIKAPEVRTCETCLLRYVAWIPPKILRKKLPTPESPVPFSVILECTCSSRAMRGRDSRMKIFVSVSNTTLTPWFELCSEISYCYFHCFLAGLLQSFSIFFGCFWILESISPCVYCCGPQNLLWIHQPWGQ